MILLKKHLAGTGLSWVVHRKDNFVAFEIIVQLHSLDLWIGFLRLKIGTAGMIIKGRWIGAWNLGQDLAIGNSINTSFPHFDLSGVGMGDDIFITEEVLVGDKWLLKDPVII